MIFKVTKASKYMDDPIEKAFDTIEELLEFQKSVHTRIIIGERDDGPYIMIYDDYIE